MTDSSGVILLADDEQDFREIFSTKLQQAGFVVYAVADGNEALVKFDEVHPDLILLDVNMPILDGISTFIRLKDKNVPLKVVFLTNLAEPRDEVSGVDDKFAQEIGAIDYIRKTDDLNKIVEEVKNIMAGGSNHA